MAAVSSDANAERIEPKVFSDVHFSVIPSDALSGHVERKLINQLEDHGGVYHPFNESTSRIDDLLDVTHIISTTSDFPQYYDALDLFIHVVKPSWVEICILKERSSNPRQFSPDPALFLSDVVATCADVPEGDEDAIYAGILAAGGQSSSFLTKLVTHIVALSMDTEICKIAVSKKLKCKIVLPHWFDDCLKLGRKISEHPYTLPDPEIFKQSLTDPIRYNENRDLVGASTLADNKTPVPTSSPSTLRRDLLAFTGRHVMLSSDLGLHSHLQDTLKNLIRNGGGDIATDVERADMCVCRYRDGKDYLTASRSGIDVGNLTWLYYVISHNKWTSPFRRLLHYPVPREGIPGFKDFRISLSNYTGEARVYLENLVRAAGAEFTKTMKPDNTHLITAHLNSEKCTAAKEWSVNLINHLWLEESYAKCKLLTVSNPRYTHFPPRTNMGEVVGQTQIDREAIKLYLREEEAVQAPKVLPPLHKATQSSIRTQQSHSHSETNGARVDSSNSNAAPLKDADPKKQAKRAREALATRTPVAARSHVPTGKENETPSSTGSRSAKDRAAQKLHDMAPDIQLYEKELKRAGGVVYGGRRVGDPDRVSLDGHTKANGVGKNGHAAAAGRKRSLSYEDGDEDKDDTAADKEVGRKVKKVKSGNVSESLPPVTQHLILSGYEGWSNNPKKESADRAHLRALGIEVTQDPLGATILAAPCVKRTVKFVASIVTVSYIVNTSYLEACLATPVPDSSNAEAKATKPSKDDKEPSKKSTKDASSRSRKDSSPTLPDPADYALKDPIAKQKFGSDFDINETLQRAKAWRDSGRGMLSGWRIWCSEYVKGGYDDYATIVATNGGECQLFRGRKGVVNRPSGPGAAKTATEHGDDSEKDKNEEMDDGDADDGSNVDGATEIGSFAYLITRQSEDYGPEERALHERFRAQATAAGVKSRIVSSDWLLQVAMYQRVVWNEAHLVQEG